MSELTSLAETIIRNHLATSGHGKANRVALRASGSLESRPRATSVSATIVQHSRRAIPESQVQANRAPVQAGNRAAKMRLQSRTTITSIERGLDSIPPNDPDLLIQ
jgi:hypothetical protein